MICHRVVVCPQGVETADTHRNLRRMQSPTDPEDRTGTIGVEAFDATYGAGFQASDDSPHAVECELVEDAGAFVAHRPADADRPRRVAFVDGTLRTEARLTRTGADGEVGMGLAGGWAAARGGGLSTLDTSPQATGNAPHQDRNGTCRRLPIGS